MNLSEEEKSVKKSKLFMETVFKVLYEWKNWSKENGAGFTFSTFCSESEFNVNQFLNDNFINYRKELYELIGTILNLVYNRSADLFL